MENYKRRVNRKVMVTLAILVFVGISLQFTSPEIVNPPVTSEISVPKDVSVVLKKSCYHCHSNEVKLEWLDRVAPISWIVSSDVRTARSRFNLSQWNELTPADQQVKIWEMINMAENNRMPLKSYLLFHPGAKLNEEDINILKKYAQRFIMSKPGDTVEINKADKEFRHFMNSNGHHPRPIISPNGIRYSDDYRNWKVMVATTRFENGTMRLNYGNDIAIKAMEEGKINPWPQGSVIVKVVWNMIEDKEGNIRPGTFNNTQWMVKDDKKFSQTAGWGFARFNGTALLPYGRTADFSTACFNCHKLVKETGYVFDLPVGKNN